MVPLYFRSIRLQRIECGHQLGAVAFADAQSAAIWRSSWGRDLQFRHEALLVAHFRGSEMG